MAPDQLPSRTPSPPAVARPAAGERLRAGLAGAAGAAAPLLLAAGGRLDWGAAGVTAAVLAALTVAATWTQAPSVASGSEISAADAGTGEEPPFADLVEALPDPLLVVGTRGEAEDLAGHRVVYANAAARALLRIGREGALLATALRAPEVLEAVDESLFGGGARLSTLETRGAQERSWSVWSSPLGPPDGERRLAILAMHDETAARRGERFRADFLANASHELRTPLASLAGFIETLRGHARDDPAARERFLGIMQAQADRMGRLIDDLLSLSRIEMNEHVAPAGACDLTLAVHDTLDALAPLIEERLVEVELTAPAAGAAVVVGDRDQIVQVIQNLVDNAVKYSAPGDRVEVRASAGLSLEQAQAPSRPLPEGAARLSLLTPDRREGERFALVRVSDDGPGMAREHLPRLSERFYRAPGQKSSERSGTGLGLAIVKHIVNRHRGGLIVESAPGQGSAFSVYLPLAPSAGSEPGEPVATVRRPALVEALES